MGQVGDQRCDLCLLFDTQMGVQEEEKQGYSDAVDQLISELLSEHQNVLDYATGLQEQRDKLNQEIRAETAGPVLQSVTETFEVVRLVPSKF